jgi:undecaprenyl-diphosphatase
MNESIAVMTSPWIMGIVLFVIPSIILWKQKNQKVLRQLWTSIVTTGIIGVIIKFIVQRPRPFEPEYFFGTIPDYSFPSLQTAVAFTTLPFLWKQKKNWKWGMIAYIFSIALSRIYLQEHYTSDVIAGAIIGMSVAILIQKKIT